MSELPTREAFTRALKARHGAALQQTFANATIAICGLGGLGSNIAISLARAGIGTLLLIDYDSVDISNLHRQQYKAAQIGLPKTEALTANLIELSPYIKIIPHTVRLTEANLSPLLSDADIICEAFDHPEEKAMLVNAVLERMPDKYLIAASGMAGLSSPNSIKTKKITPRFYLCGDQINEVNSETGLFSSRVTICAAHQAHTALRILAKEYDP